MSISKNYLAVKACSLFYKINKNLKCLNGFQPLRTINSDKSIKPQGSNVSKENSGNPFSDLPPLDGFDDENFTKYFRRMLANPSFFLTSARNFSDECKAFIKMKRDEYNSARIIMRNPENHIDMLFTFEKEEDVDKFLVTSDRTNNTGHSTGALTLTQDKTALFSGYLNTEPIKSGNVKVAGFANMLSPRKRVGFRIKGCYDWLKYTHLVLKVRGDGRTYLVLLPVPQKYEEAKGLVYAHPLFTRGGPYWQIAKIPFSYFFLMFNGRMADFQNNPIALNQIGNLGITAAGFDGNFKLEIDYIGLEFDPHHQRNSPYEEYEKKF